MKTWLFPQLFALLALSIFVIGDTAGPRTRCKDGERKALLKFKDSLYFDHDRNDPDRDENDDAGIVLSNWGVGEAARECCEWTGILCDNETGRIIALDLSPDSLGLREGAYLGGRYQVSTPLLLAELRDLIHLDLSFVDLNEDFDASFVGSFGNRLKYLNLSSNSLYGEVPAELGNFSRLQVLDLSLNGLDIGSLSWASGLSSLRLLDLNSANMSGAGDWLRVVNDLPSLTHLALPRCSLQEPSEFSVANTSKGVIYLDLSSNEELTNSTFKWLFNFSRSLVHLDISGCKLELASIPEEFPHISYLDLSNNLIGGSIPGFFENLTFLTHLDLGQNRFKGVVPESLGRLSSLEFLNVSINMLHGELPESIWESYTLKYFDAHDNILSGHLEFGESSSRCAYVSLEYLDLRKNRFTGRLSNLTLLPSLEVMRLSTNRLSGDVSESIGKFSKLKVLDLGFNSIEATISEAHFGKLSSLSHLDLSSNKHIVFDVSSDWIPPFQLEHINLGSCNLGLVFPRWLKTQKNYIELNMSHSGISDSIPGWLWNFQGKLHSLDLSNNKLKGKIPDFNESFINDASRIDLSMNQLEGSIPRSLLLIDLLNLKRNKFSDISSICQASSALEFLDVSYNELSGELPDCWAQMTAIQFLIMKYNKLTGEIPASIGLMIWIETLHLSNNNFSGTLPLSFQYLKRLVVFDVGGNNLTGEIPTWIGTSSKNIVVLSLRSNHFSGSMKRNLCQLQKLQVLDLSSNNLSGNIPTCLSNFTAMRRAENGDSNGPHLLKVAAFDYSEFLESDWKGTFTNFENILILKNMDLSNNNMSGEIPEELTQLIGLIQLNLSRNNLSGRIPGDIGRMQSLDALDLSRNHLSGRIPSSLSQIDRLGILDLSSNNLSDKIPSGTQLQSREASAYEGNPELCGAPLPRECPDEKDPKPPNSKRNEDSHEDQDEDENITTGIYVSAAIGYFIGFCGICGTLVFIKYGKN